MFNQTDTPENGTEYLDGDALIALAERWQIPVTRVARLVGLEKPGAEIRGAKLRADRHQARFLRCLLEIEFTLWVLYGTKREWLTRRNRSFAGRAPLDCIHPADTDSASAVLGELVRRCERPPRPRS